MNSVFNAFFRVIGEVALIISDGRQKSQCAEIGNVFEMFEV